MTDSLRRQFFLAAGAAIVAASLPAFAQQPVMNLKDFPTVMGGRFSMAQDRQSVLPVNLWRAKGGQLAKLQPGEK